MSAFQHKKEFAIVRIRRTVLHFKTMTRNKKEKSFSILVYETTMNIKASREFTRIKETFFSFRYDKERRVGARRINATRETNLCHISHKINSIPKDERRRAYLLRAVIKREWLFRRVRRVKCQHLRVLSFSHVIFRLPRL